MTERQVLKRSRQEFELENAVRRVRRVGPAWQRPADAARVAGGGPRRSAAREGSPLQGVSQEDALKEGREKGEENRRKGEERRAHELGRRRLHRNGRRRRAQKEGQRQWVRCGILAFRPPQRPDHTRLRATRCGDSRPTRNRSDSDDMGDEDDDEGADAA